MVQFYFTMPPGTVRPLLDAGIVPTVPEEEFTITSDDWLMASSEELSWLHDVPLHMNQEASIGTEFNGDVKVRIRYSTPCITSLGRT